jgi:hypothetical protein
MKKILVIALALALSIALVVPVLADVDTTVTISAGGGEPPVVKCKWEQDLTPSLEDGDPTHQNLGSAFLPPCSYKGKKAVQYWAVVTDEEDNGDVAQVYADIYHPDTKPECGSFKYEVPYRKVDKFAIGIPAFKAAYKAGLIKFNEGHTYETVLLQLEKCTADVWMGEADLDYHQQAGDYLVKCIAIDQSDNPSKPLDNTFLYVPTPCIEIDFDSISYGSVRICQNKWVAGDTIFDSPVAAAPDPNPATIRNIGNTNVKIRVQQDDMGFHQDVTGMWNVEFDARLGNDPANGVVYDPYETKELPNTLPLCNTEELDFSIHIKKGMSGDKYTGKMTVSAVVDPFEKCPEE